MDAESSPLHPSVALTSHTHAHWLADIRIDYWLPPLDIDIDMDIDIDIGCRMTRQKRLPLRWLQQKC